jgi:phosphatidylinositol alpha 1,6-mannosyltransferase
MHDSEPGADDAWVPTARWLWSHVRPWAGRRLRGVTAGDGRFAKHTQLVPVVPTDPTMSPAGRG